MNSVIRCTYLTNSTVGNGYWPAPNALFGFFEPENTYIHILNCMLRFITLHCARAHARTHTHAHTHTHTHTHTHWGHFYNVLVFSSPCSFLALGPTSIHEVQNASVLTLYACSSSSRTSTWLSGVSPALSAWFVRDGELSEDAGHPFSHPPPRAFFALPSSQRLHFYNIICYLFQGTVLYSLEQSQGFEFSRLPAPPGGFYFWSLIFTEFQFQFHSALCHCHCHC